ncbi:MAG: hypothetical protein IT282_13040 [Bacteroidetes bacterium]|nr:hypothetical protein [Bacteroidota bacterium]
MSDVINTYTFLPWLRQGLANNIAAADLDASVKTRATIDVAVAITGTGVDEVPDTPPPIAKKVGLYGPGDIIGIESSVIVKVEPRNWITNFEPNYLPHIEFYDEDFPWRYTPATPDTGTHRLRPWIMLVVLKETEFEEGANIAGKPLPFVTLKVDPLTSFPDSSQLWAWAHVHINKDIVQTDNQTRSTDTSAILPRVDEIISATPDLAYSRIMCPRLLEENTAYHAFLIPVFESGRLAGLGLDPDDSPAEVHATFSAWAGYAGKPSDHDFPYYHRWYFRTGTVGDFEYLVRLLQPKPVDIRVGRRDIDVQQPMVNFPGIRDPQLGGVLKLGGALQVPVDTMKEEEKEEYEKYEKWALPYPHEFQERLAAFINLADDYARLKSEEANTRSGLEIPIDPQTGEDDPDPLITPPLYGRWHAMVTRALRNRAGEFVEHHTNWVHDLNLDPRFRVAAGFGTKVIQDKQEEYMDAAWGQVGEIIEANRRFRLAELAKRASLVWYRDHLLALRQASPEQAFRLCTPLHKRILSQNRTVYFQIKSSPVPNAALTPAMRRVTRPRSRLMKAMEFGPEIRPDNLLTRLNEGKVVPVQPKQVPAGLPTMEQVAADMKPRNVPGFLLDWLKRFPWLRFLPLAVIIVMLVIFVLSGFSSSLQYVTYAVVAAMGALFEFLRRMESTSRMADSMLPENQIPAAVEDLPKSPDFRITDPGSTFQARTGGSDSVEAQHYKTALRSTYALVADSKAAAALPAPVVLEMPQLIADSFVALNPGVTLPRHVFAGIHLPDRLRAETGEDLKPAMAYPEIDVPMYKPLTEISAEHFLPNIHLIEQNTISLLETNQKFIESYMVGLNHEFARELLWREYPTDQRGSYFRQFWDVSSHLNKQKLNPEALREKLRDIPPLDKWPRNSDLGDHDHREQGGDKEEELVLVIRGELLKKYPTAVIYAHKAKWQRKADGSIDNSLPRDFEDGEPMEAVVKTPLYEAKVDPDIYFFGFDLTTEEAKGESGESAGDNPGWFFVIKERPGEPRFGLDMERTGDLRQWNDLAWTDVLPGGSGGVFIDVGSSSPSLALPSPSSAPDSEEGKQQREDVQVRWNASNAAELAYILYQVPVMIGVHAMEMLPKETGT